MSDNSFDISLFSRSRVGCFKIYKFYNNNEDGNNLLQIKGWPRYEKFSTIIHFYLLIYINIKKYNYEFILIMINKNSIWATNDALLMLIYVHAPLFWLMVAGNIDKIVPLIS